MPARKKGDPNTPSKKIVLEIVKDANCKISTRQFTEADRKLEGNKIFGILGIINIEGFNFLVVVAERRAAGKLKQGCAIYEVMGIKLVPLFRNGALDGPQSVTQFREGIEKLLSNTGFYFSYYTDLTVSQ